MLIGITLKLQLNTLWAANPWEKLTWEVFKSFREYQQPSVPLKAQLIPYIIS